MIHQLLSTLLLIVGLISALPAQEGDKPDPIKIRAVYHDPLNYNADLYYTNKDGQIEALNFRPKALTGFLDTLPINGSLVLYDNANVDPEDPGASVAASAKIPSNLQKAIVLVIPAPKGQSPAYRMLVVNDSAQAFPKGESRVISMVGANTVIEAGEHKVAVHPGKIAKIPAVRKVNNFNMAQVNFYYQHGGEWIPFSERQLQFIDANRRLFIIHATPGALAPTVSTIVDTARPVATRP